jgi:ribosomal protein L19
MNPIIQEITAAQVKKDITPFKVGDGVRVHTKVREGDKERVQVYAGIVIARKGAGIHETFTVRRLSYGEGRPVSTTCVAARVRLPWRSRKRTAPLKSTRLRLLLRLRPRPEVEQRISFEASRKARLFFCSNLTVTVGELNFGLSRGWVTRLFLNGFSP